jgi:CheY-like chemotaxis protein
VKGPTLFPAPAGVGSEAKGSSGGGGGESICAALVYGDKRVRYAAAIALAKLNPPQPFANSEKVMEDLSDALNETGQRVILVVEREPDARNRIVGLLRERGYMTFGVDNGNEGLIRAKSFPGEDLIIVSSELNREGKGSDPVEFQFIDSLRDDYRTKTIPVMVLAPRNRDKDMQELVDEKRAVDVITPDIDGAILNEKVKKVFSGPDYQADEKARNDQIAKDAAMAIASIHGATVFDLGAVSKSLSGCLARADDSVRIAAMKAIAAAGPKAKNDCLEPLLTVFKTKENSVDVREAAAVAIGECMKGSPLDAAADVFKTLKAATNEEDERIWKAAGTALGKAQLSGEAARQLLEEQRIE